MKHVELNKLSRQLYALIFGPQNITPMAQKMSKKMMFVNYKQYKLSLRGNGDMLLKSMIVGDKCPKFSDLMISQLAKYITLADNSFVYGGTAE